MCAAIKRELAWEKMMKSNADNEKHTILANSTFEKAILPHMILALRLLVLYVLPIALPLHNVAFFLFNIDIDKK